MYRSVILASVVVLAVGGTGCARGGADRGDSASTSILGPSAVGEPAAPTLSAKGGGGGKPSGGGSGTSSLTLVMYTDNNGNGLPNWNDTVTFNVSTTATTVPYVNLKCYQGGAMVASASAGFFDGYAFSWAQLMTLSSRTWTSGAADCTADLGYYNTKGAFVLLSSLSFHVDA